jgi:hypothetical protein
MRDFRTRVLAALLTALLSGCATARPAAPVATPAPTPAPTADPGRHLSDANARAPVGPGTILKLDRVSEAIARAESEFQAGRVEFDKQHLVAAREHFDRAIDILLKEPGRHALRPAVASGLRWSGRANHRA